jgi:two-component system, LytTR family, response regulator
MTRFRVLVADDEPLARRMVAALLQGDKEIESVIECGDARTAREMIARHGPDIVFLDIEMPEVSGLDVAADLKEDGPVIVFITAYSRYATDAFEVEASDYVLKPFSDERFAEAVQRAKRRVRQRRLGKLADQLATLSSELRPGEREPSPNPETKYLTRLAFKHEDRAIVLKTSDVVWIEAEDYYVRIHSKRGRHLIRTSLASLEARLDPREFLRVHRAAIVNVDEVREIRDTGVLGVILSDGTEVPVSRSRRSSVESALLPRLRQPRG